MDNAQFRILRRGTPGSFTFLLRATSEVPRRAQHRSRGTIGVRVPDHAVVMALLAEQDEPILSSTLILPGEPEPLNDADAIAARLGSHVDAILDAGPCPAAPTTVIDLATSPPVVIRLGRADPGMLGLAVREAGNLR